MEEKETMIQIDNVSKIYKLGEIGGTTLTETFQRLFAKIRHKEDPTKKIGAKNYNKGEKFKALDGINLTIKKGERVGIIGHNGAGKSTLLKLICRITAPTEGEIGLNGRVTSMLEVGTGFHPELTGRENVYMNGAILGMTKKEIDGIIEDIIDFSEVREFIDTPVKRYSSGMYVKLAFSVAAHLDSEIMIMDEVLAVGDVQFQRKCISKMSEVSKKEDRTILYVSHNMSTIRELCDRIVVLKNGHVIFDGDVEEGIGVYLSNSFGEDSTLFDVSDFLRPSNSLNEVHISRVELLNKEKCIYERGEKALLKLTIDSYAKLTDLRARFIIRNSSDYPIGTAISNSFGDTNNNDTINCLFELDTTHLVRGSYTISMAIIHLDDNGNDIIYDHVTRACMIKITETNKREDKINRWEQVWWGNIHYPSLIAKKLP